MSKKSRIEKWLDGQMIPFADSMGRWLSVPHRLGLLVVGLPNKAWSRLEKGVAKFARKIAEFVIR